MGVVASITEITINSHGPGAGTVPICFYFSGCEDLTGISRMGKVLYPTEDTRLLKGPVSGCRLHQDSCDGDKNADALFCILSVMATPIIPFHIPRKGSRKPEKVTHEQREAQS